MREREREVSVAEEFFSPSYSFPEQILCSATENAV